MVRNSASAAFSVRAWRIDQTPSRAWPMIAPSRRNRSESFGSPRSWVITAIGSGAAKRAIRSNSACRSARSNSSVITRSTVPA